MANSDSHLDSSELSILANRIFQESEQNPSSDSVGILLNALGTSFRCDRVFICERRKNGSFDNTYEWCAPGVVSTLDVFQNNPASTYASWYSMYKETHDCYFQNVSDLKNTSPFLCHGLVFIYTYTILLLDGRIPDDNQIFLCKEPPLIASIDTARRSTIPMTISCQ